MEAICACPKRTFSDQNRQIFTEIKCQNRQIFTEIQGQNGQKFDHPAALEDLDQVSELRKKRREAAAKSHISRQRNKVAQAIAPANPEKIAHANSEIIAKAIAHANALSDEIAALDIDFLERRRLQDPGEPGNGSTPPNETQTDDDLFEIPFLEGESAKSSHQGRNRYS